MDRIEIVVPNNAGSPVVGQGAAQQTTPRLSAVRAVRQMLLFALILLAGLMALVQAGKQSAFLGELPVLGLLQSSLLVVVFLGICALVLFSPVVFLLHYLRRGRQGALGRSLYTGAVGLQVALMVFAGLLPALAPSFVVDLAQQTPVIGDKLLVFLCVGNPVVNRRCNENPR